MKKYKVYSYYKLLHLIDKVDNIEEAINLIENVIYKEDSNYLIVERDVDTNTEAPIKSIRSIEDFLQYKEEQLQPKKTKKLKK